MDGLVDLDHWFGGDIAASSGGVVLTASGTLRSRQRVLRRLLTSPSMPSASGQAQAADYTWHPSYGAGLRQKVGGIINVQELTGLIVAQLRQEDSVASIPAPVVTVTLIRGGMAVFLKYTESGSGQPVTLGFNVTE